MLGSFPALVACQWVGFLRKSAHFCTCIGKLPCFHPIRRDVSRETLRIGLQKLKNPVTRSEKRGYLGVLLQVGGRPCPRNGETERLNHGGVSPS